ncbi:hypothetical protein L7F22_012135 [Adiantum nelumboides]|nr:hypothetical protein [Adiantum nelumboides]
MRHGSSTQEQHSLAAQYINHPQSFRKIFFRKFQGAPSHQFPNTSRNCSYCRRRGHGERECRTKKRDQQRRVGCRGANSHEMNSSNLDQYGLESLQLFTSIIHAVNTLVPLKSPGAEWLLDTGATHHMTPHRHWLTGYKLFPNPVHVFLGDDPRLNAKGVGHMPVTLPSGTQVLIHGILHIPGLSRNLLSVTAATSKGSSMEFFHDYCAIHFKLPSGGYEVLRLPQKDRLYPILLSPTDNQTANSTSFAMTTTLTKASSTLLWHYRLGHINSPTLHLWQNIIYTMASLEI